MGTAGRVLALLALMLLLACARAAAPVTMQVYVRGDCPHCADAKVFLAGLQRERPHVVLVYRPVDDDPKALDELIALAQRAGGAPPGVPTFVIGGRTLVGFDDAEHAGRDLVRFVDEGVLPEDEVRLPVVGTLSASRLGLPAFTLVLGLLDGFNPCAMWVLLFLLALLVRLNDRRRMAAIAGTFVLASGIVYYAFMAAWLNVFLAVGMSDALRWLLGLVAIAIGAVNAKDFIAPGRGFSLSIPEAAKPGLHARMRRVVQSPGLVASLGAVSVLAFVVNLVELLCTAGIPAIYTAVLARQELPAWAHHGYLGLYIVGYVADDTVMVASAVLALGSRKLTERAGRWLKLLSGSVMLVLGALLLLAPQWLW